MILDCDRFKANLPSILWLTRDTAPEERYDMISVIATTYNIPVIVSACLLGQLYGFNVQLYRLIVQLKHFYGVTKILNWKG
jgi:hypothetical protein